MPIWDSEPVRSTVAAAVVLMAAGLAAPAPAAAGECNDAFCTPGVKPAVVLGAPCVDTASYVFGTTSWGRLAFCGAPRRYEPRYFRSPPMMGVKELNASCEGYENAVAQAPDGQFLTCSFANNHPVWARGGNA